MREDPSFHMNEPPFESAQDSVYNATSGEIHDAFAADDPVPEAAFQAQGIAAVLQVVEEAAAYLRHGSTHRGTGKSQPRG